MMTIMMTHLALSLLIVLPLLSIVASTVDIPERARGGSAWKESSTLQSKAHEKAPVFATWKSKLDNFNPLSNTTFTQRYLVDSQFYDKANPGPVFLYIGGEGTLTGVSGYVSYLAQNYSALILALEHRFYGDSVPDSIPDPMATPNLRYLSVGNALADLAAFTDFYKSSIDPGTKDRPWFVFGGSYPGALASWYRIAYPEHSVGSLSSSGVVNCIVDYTGFDKQVSAAIGNTCSDQIRRIQGAFERMVQSADGWTKAL
jgi:pimeloyl-ACP methyl ester carboxylesterase